MKRILLLIAFFAVFLGGMQPVKAQNNVSCNDSYYHNENYIDVKVPDSGPAGTQPIINLWGDSQFNLRVVIKKGSTTLATINPNAASGARRLDQRTVSWGDTIRYYVYVMGGSVAYNPRWMPANVTPNSGKCGTGCYVDSGQYLAVVDVSALYNASKANGETPYNLTTSGTSLFLNAQRTPNTIDTAMTCWNDQPQEAGTADDDFNDWQLTWSISSTTPVASAPVVVTNAATNVELTTATLNGTVSSDGGSAITERGFVYSNAETTPTIGHGTKVTVTGTTGNLAKDVSGLTSGIRYYYQAYATNAQGTTYGGVKEFIMNDDPQEFVVQTDPATQITVSSATLNGEVITSPNTVVERGFVYTSETNAPTVGNGTKVTTTGTLGTMNRGITGLEPQTTYYFVAYAQDDTGAYAYGQVRSFTTPSSPSPYHTPDDTGIAEDTMILAGAVLYVVGIVSFMGSKAITKKLGAAVVPQM